MVFGMRRVKADRSVEWIFGGKQGALLRVLTARNLESFRQLEVRSILNDALVKIPRGSFRHSLWRAKNVSRFSF